MDALADVLRTIRLKTTTYFCTDFHAPWGMNVGQRKDGLFHVVVEGDCWLKLEHSETVIHLQEGDIVAFPTGGAHWISDQSHSRVLPGPSVVEQILAGDNPFAVQGQEEAKAITLMCGSFDYDSSINHPFLKDLPCFIHIKSSETPELDWLRSLVTVLSYESRVESPGSTVMVDRLTEVLFIQIMRAYTKSHVSKMGYMAALMDSQIGEALNAIHTEDEAYWTVERLGNHVAMSRTAFSEKFSKLVGIPAKTYLVNWRMQKAREHLQSGVKSMYEIAEIAGYSSEAAFSKAFKQFFGVSPGKVRKGAHSSEEQVQK